MMILIGQFYCTLLSVPLVACRTYVTYMDGVFFYAVLSSLACLLACVLCLIRLDVDRRGEERRGGERACEQMHASLS